MGSEIGDEMENNQLTSCLFQLNRDQRWIAW